MRRLEYLSPTSVSSFFNEPAEFYLQRLCDVRPPKFKQTKPMAIGSGFDAYVKCYLYEKLIGKKNPKFDTKNLLQEQIETEDPDLYSWVVEEAAYVFICYKECGALAALMQDLGKGINTRVEATVRGTVEGVPLLGKPDLSLRIREEGMTIEQALTADIFILDWKVNGYCSRSPVSPKKGYVTTRSCHQFRGLGREHREAELELKNGILYNKASCLSEIDKSWAAQTCTYAWLLGAKPGSNILCGIDQLACKPIPEGRPWIRVASYRNFVSKDYQRILLKKYKECWDILTRDEKDVDEYFRSVGVDPDGLKKEADMLAKLKEGDKNDQWLLNSFGR